MAAGECRSRTLARLLCTCHKLIEEPIDIARRRHSFGVAAEISAQDWEVPTINLINAHSLEIILRTCYRQEDIDGVEKEKDVRIVADASENCERPS